MSTTTTETREDASMGEVECPSCANGKIVDAENDQVRKCLDCRGRGTLPAKAFRWAVEIVVSEVWVADGFDLTEERLKEMVMSDLSCAHGHEVRVAIVKRPDPKAIAKAQGY